MTLRVAIVGCGSIAESHVEEIGKIADADVVAVCDLEMLMAEQLGERYGIAGRYDDFERMLDEAAPDVVHITTPPQSHFDLAVRAMDAGCHVLVEKPVAPTWDDTRALLDHARRAGRKLTAGHIYQFDPPALALRRLVARGVVGEVTHIDSHFGYNLEGNFGRGILASPSHWVHALPGNLPHNNLSHALARVVEFMPCDAPRVQVSAQRAAADFGDVRDRLIRELRAVLSDRGVTACVNFTCSARPVGQWVRVSGSANTVRADFVSRTVTFERRPALPSALGRLLAAFPQGWEYHREGWKNVVRFLRYRFHFQAGMNELFRRFYRSIQDGTDPPIPYLEIETVARLMDDIFARVASDDGEEP